MNLLEVLSRPVRSLEEKPFQTLMQEHHYLGCLPKISETLWYVATFRDQWVALLTFSAAALKCSARDRWIGWDFRHQYDWQLLGQVLRKYLLVTGQRASSLECPTPCCYACPRRVVEYGSGNIEAVCPEQEAPPLKVVDKALLFYGLIGHHYRK